MSGTMEFEFSAATRGKARHQRDDPFVMLVLGNFSGHSDRHPDDPSWLMQVPVRNVDLDNIERLWADIKPLLNLNIEDCQVCFEPAGLDDFHPDQLYRALPVFEELRQIRKRLLDPATAPETLSQLIHNQSSAIESSTDGVDEPSDVGDDPTQSGEQMFERLLGGNRSNQSTASAGSNAEFTAQGIDRLLHKAVAAHIVHEPDPRVESAIDAVDKTTAETMREILHHPEFQSLESAWRSLYELICASELGEQLLLKVCNVGKAELLAGLPQSMENMQASGLYQLLVSRAQRAADDVAYSLLACNYYFGGDADDVALLASLGSMAELTNAVVIGAAKSELIGTASVAQKADFNDWTKVDNPLWQQLRTSPMAKRIGLALPRILGRLPYGDDHERISSFEFEEMLSEKYDHARHANFLWVNPCLYLAALLAQSFTGLAWDMRPDDHTDIGGLPVYTYAVDGEKRMLPTAEALISERSAEAILQLGLMPVVSFRNRDMARLLRFQSIADPVASLEGPW